MNDDNLKEIGHNGFTVDAETMASVLFDFATHADYRAAVKKEFERDQGAVRRVSGGAEKGVRAADGAGSEIGIGESGIRDQGSGIRDQGSGIRDQGSGIGIRDQGSGIRDQGSGIRERGSGSGRSTEGIQETLGEATGFADEVLEVDSLLASDVAKPEREFGLGRQF